MGCGLIEEVMGLANWVRASRGIWGQNRERRCDDCSGDVIFDGEERSLGSRAEQGSSGQMRLRLVCRRWKERRDLIGRLLLVFERRQGLRRCGSVMRRRRWMVAMSTAELGEKSRWQWTGMERLKDEEK
ncbi:hypothetical protein M0R45_031760 [Rubus argutus]|uniref:Uncharacterized protein n=1 Tax=Rubus argutus TaxID=59490 RepID=A0AAW1WHF1_RUBAR